MIFPAMLRVQSPDEAFHAKSGTWLPVTEYPQLNGGDDG
jgi:hypothetical protein